MQAEAKKYLARFEKPEDGQAAASDTVTLSARERRRLERAEQRRIREENKQLREEDKQLTEMDNEINRNASKKVKKPKADKETKRTENTETEHGN